MVIILEGRRSEVYPRPVENPEFLKPPDIKTLEKGMSRARMVRPKFVDRQNRRRYMVHILRLEAPPFVWNRPLNKATHWSINVRVCEGLPRSEAGCET